jgi:predicted nuclease of restriction endonuclease-like (RecB) superfamily
MDREDKIEENLKKIEDLKAQNFYCFKQIEKSKENWEIKEYKEAIRENLAEIRLLSNHNKVLGGFN